MWITNPRLRKYGEEPAGRGAAFDRAVAKRIFYAEALEIWR